MTAQDFFVTPIFFVLLSLLAFLVRPHVTTSENRKYFFPALWTKMFGAIMLGFLYQFYYGGGDTFNYFEHGSKWIWKAFTDDFLIGLQLMLDSGGQARDPETFLYNQHIWYYRDARSFFIIRITAFFDLFTFHTYSSTALLFAVFCFSGSWAMYHVLFKKYRGIAYLHVAILFVPSVVFWGSGILKDTITFGALGWLTWAVLSIVELKRRTIIAFLVAILSTLIVLQIKPYVVVLFIPFTFLWIYLKFSSAIRNQVVKLLAMPFLTLMMGAVVYFSISVVSTDEYNLDNFAEKAAITAYDIRYGWGARTAGDGGYDLGGLPDGSIQSMIRLMPAAINVTIFRPYLWEVKNPLMLLSALESVVILMLSIRLMILRRFRFSEPFLVFCLLFSLAFAFAVGISTFNFGTLMRYKIPMMPFLAFVLVYSKKKHKPLNNTIENSNYSVF